MRQSDTETSTNAQNDTQGVEPHLHGSAWDRLQRVALTSFAVVGTVALLGLAACPADLANPGDYDHPAANAGGATGGGGSGAGGANTDPKLAVPTTCLEQVFADACASAPCHMAPATIAGLDLSSPGVNTRLIDVVAPHLNASPNTGCMPNQKLIDSANPTASWLLLKLDTDGKTCGSKMPIAAMDITAEQKKCIQDYVTAVAAAAGGT